MTARENWRIIRIMKKLPNIIFCLCLLFVSVTFTQELPTEPTKSEDSTNEEIAEIDSSDDETLDEEEDGKFFCDLPANVTALELSHTEIVLNCPASDEPCSNNKIIKVKTVALKPEGVEQKYVYTISAGKIIGEGSNVEWDLSDAKPGTYVITAGISQPVSDGTRWEVLGQTQTKVVTVKESPNYK